MTVVGSLALSLNVAEVRPHGTRVRIEASAAECADLAKELDLQEVAELTADLDVRPAGEHAFVVRGELAARVVQTDVVTLEPLAQAISESVDATLVPAKNSEDDATSAAADGEDQPDVFHGGSIPVGVLVAEHLALGLDPYPRAPGVEFAGHIEDDSTADSPLAALAALKRKDEG